jgi:hypothetical protein
MRLDIRSDAVLYARLLIDASRLKEERKQRKPLTKDV